MTTPGEPCRECGAPLAADQRYCLNCGRRSGGPRVDYRHYMAAAAAGGPGQGGGATGEPVPPPDETEAGDRQKPERDYAPFAAVGGIAVLGLMLLVGVLIGKGGNDTAQAPAPIVVHGGGEAESTSGEAEGASSEAKVGKAKGKSSASSKGSSLAGGGSGKEEEPVEASSEALESLQSESGGSYEEQSKKLPNKIATPGKPPPIDKSKPAGGGEGGAEVIK